jgi:hypothetical protein
MAVWLGVLFLEMLWDKTLLVYCNVLSGNFLERHSQIVKKKVLVWDTRFEPGTSRDGSKYANCPSAAFHVFTSIYYFISAPLYDAFSTTYVT